MLSQIIQEIQDNGIQIYTGEIDEEEDSADIKELRVRQLTRVEHNTYMKLLEI